MVLRNPNSMRTAEERSDELHDAAQLGHQTQAVLTAFDPVIEKRLGQLLDQFSEVAPELGPLLDLRSKISEVWRIRRELKKNINKGQSATDVITKILTADGNVSGNRTP